MRLTILLLALVLQTSLQAQTTYDVFTYTEPKGYKKELKKGFASYTKTDNKAGTYCIIGLYTQRPSSGNLSKDFDTDWKTLVVTPLNVTATPEKDNGDEITGWKTYSGGANFEFSGGSSMALLTTAKKDNANVAILIVTNSQTFLTTDVDLFFEKLKLGKPKTIVTSKQPDTLKTSKKNADTTKSIVIKKELLGEWYLSDGNAKMTLLFGANGRYDRGSLVDRRITRDLYETTTYKGKGAYTIQGNTLTISPTSGAKEIYQYRIAFEKNAENKIDKILYLVRPVSGGQLYESAYYFVK